MRDDAWFSGFTAGEGCFLIARRNRDRLAPLFGLCLRADDLEILERLRDTFGGTLKLQHGRGKDNPSVYWQVAKKSELAGLVAYFDRFPLCAKKARDYALWRRAARAYCAQGSHAPELWPLREALMEGRKYGASEAQPVVSPQLRLVS